MTSSRFWFVRQSLLVKTADNCRCEKVRYEFEHGAVSMSKMSHQTRLQEFVKNRTLPRPLHPIWD